MIKFVLEHSKLIERNLSPKLVVQEAIKPSTIQICIDYFNKEVAWEDMFNLDDALYRIEKGDRMFTGYYDGVLFGYCWLSKENKGKYYIYNMFSRKEPIERKYGATDLLYYVIKRHTKGVIWAKVDKWNTKSIHVFEKLGFSRS